MSQDRSGAHRLLRVGPERHDGRVMGGGPASIARRLRGAFASGRRTQAVVLVGGLALVGLLWLAIAAHLAERRASILEQTQRDVTNLSVALAAQVSRLIEGTDQIMRLIQADHDTDPETFDFHAWMRRATLLDAVTVQVAMFDDHGDMIASRVDPKPGAPRVNIADRPYFRALAENPEAGLHVGRTVQGRILGVPAFQLVRRLNRPDKGFAGLLIVALSPDYLATQFKALELGRESSVVLFGRDGYVRARWPTVEGMYDTDVSRKTNRTGLFGELERAPVGTYRFKSVFDGKERVFGYRSLEGHPLVVTVGKSVGEVLAPLEIEQRWEVVIGAAVTVVLLGALVALLRELDRRRRREAQLVQAHAAAAVSEARFRLIADHSTDVIVQLDAQGRRLFISPACRHLLGYEPISLIGSNPKDDVHPDDRPAFDATMAALASGERRGSTSSHRFRHRNGHYVWVEASWQAVWSADGVLTGYVASVRDVTARHAAETALRESEERYRTLSDALPQLVWVSRPSDGEAVYVNRRFDSYCGPVGNSRAARRALFEPTDLHRMETAKAAAAITGGPAEIEGRLRRHDGVWRWHKIVMVPIFQHGAIAEWLGTALDIDEIVSARETLEETSALLRIAQEAAGTGSWDFDLVTQTVAFSHESARMHGVPGEGPIVLPLSEWATYVRAEDLDETQRRVAEAVATRKPLETEFRVTHPDGSTRWLQGIGRTFEDEAGNPIRMIGLNFDITERKAAELALVEAKTAAEAARLEAERASAAKTDFLASMSHEIRTPLNAIIGFTDLLAGSDRLAPDLKRQAGLAHSSGTALLTIVNDILDFSEVETGRIELDRRPFSPVALVDNCLSIVRGSASAKGLDVHATLDSSLPRGLVGDDARLRQVLLNLLNNAVKFTSRGSVALNVRYEGWSPRGEKLRFSVTDTGIGIPKDKQHRLFARFSQVDGSIRRDFGGTGLGLAICKRLVGLMDGDIGVLSDEGHGATFWFALALPRGAVAGPAEVTAAPATRRTGRLLLVEDVAINQELARAVLEAVGHHIDVVADGASAVAAVQEASYDLVLMDVQMPGMDGMTATRLIRALDHPARGLPIIAMTANVLPDEVMQFHEAGMDDHVGKPFNRAHLYAVIDRWLPSSPESAADAAPSVEANAEFDEATFGEVLDLNGPSGVVRLLGYLEGELTRSFRLEPGTTEARTQLRREAHVLVSAAGMIGFSGLSAACAALEAIEEDAGVGVFEERLSEARSWVEAAIVHARALSALHRGNRDVAANA